MDDWDNKVGRASTTAGCEWRLVVGQIGWGLNGREGWDEVRRVYGGLLRGTFVEVDGQCALAAHGLPFSSVHGRQCCDW